jgi:PAS domain S-box-containing protein
MDLTTRALNPGRIPNSGKMDPRHAAREDRTLARRLRLLVVMMILTAAPLAVALWILPGRIQELLTSQGETQLSQIAVDLATLTQRTMELQLQTVQSLGSLPELRQALEQHRRDTLTASELDALNARLFAMVRSMSTDLQGIYLCGADGHIFAGSLQAGGTEAYRSVDISDREYFLDARRLGKPLVSDPIVSKISGLPVVAVVTPILDEAGSFIGLLGMTIKIEHLSKLISSKRFGATGFPFAMDRQGRVVAHPDPSRYLNPNQLDHPESQRLRARMTDGEQGLEQYVSKHGARKLAAFAPAPLCGWSIAACMEIEEFKAPARKIQHLLTVLLTACLLTGMVIACTLLLGLKRLNKALANARASDQKIAEQAALLDEIHESIVVRAMDGTVQLWNRGGFLTYGWEPQETIGLRHGELIGAETEAYEKATEVLLSKGSWNGKFQAKRKDGREITIGSRWTLLRDDKGSPVAIIAVETDITELIALEEKLGRTQRMESLGTLAGGIAHDLNNLLAPILMGANLAQLEPLSASQKETIEIIEQSARRGADLVRQVLAFAKGVKGSLISVHLSYVIQEIQAITRSTFPKKIQIRTEVPEDVQLIQADPTQLSQIILNLCVNARDAMPEGGVILIRAFNQQVDEAICTQHPELQVGPYVCIETSDTGQGIPKDVLPRIFEPFFTTKAPGKGTGLGLSTVLGIVKAMGGSISVYSETGKGTTFRIYLPVGTEGPCSSPPEQADIPYVQGTGELILLVDDEAAIREIATRILESNGYRVISADNGKDALSLYESQHDSLSLVISDMMMPVMDGETLASEIAKRSNPRPILGMSGLSDPTQRRSSQGTQLHMLAKPFSISTLLAAVAAALKKQAPRS